MCLLSVWELLNRVLAHQGLIVIRHGVSVGIDPDSIDKYILVPQ